MLNKSLTTLIVIASLTVSSLGLARDLFPQAETVSRQDVLRGSITPERAWWDVSHYRLSVKVEPTTKRLIGSNIMTYRVLAPGQVLQIELQPPMKIDRVTFNDQTLTVTQDGYSYFIDTGMQAAIGAEQAITIDFSGQPTEAIRAPWDGGIVWSKDEKGVDFIASANQGIGASIWWPNKDHAYDEPDRGIDMLVEVPEHLVDVSNGRLISVEHNQTAKTKTYHWQVVNPINNYGVNINVGNYVHFGEKHQGEAGELDMDYWVLAQNLDKAKRQFKDAKRTIEALEYWFGPYPFYEDSFKLVEAPYLGMEHQSSVTYGNGYKNGYKGTDRSRTGQGMLFDFIIVHETGHEWFANNITHKDVADMWIHESFTNYSESLFLEYHYGKEVAFEYIRGLRANISNSSPIIGQYNVHREGSSDMYDKGGNLLHTLRQLVDNDDTWRGLLRGLNQQFRHQTVTTEQIEQFIAQQTGKQLKAFFDQYLRDYRLPILETFVKGKKLSYRWTNAITTFDMPIKVMIDGQPRWLDANTQWQQIELPTEAKHVVPDANFYVGHLSVLGQ